MKHQNGKDSALVKPNIKSNKETKLLIVELKFPVWGLNVKSVIVKLKFPVNLGFEHTIFCVAGFSPSQPWDFFEPSQ